MIDIAVTTGCDAVKFQKRTVDVVYTQEELAKAGANSSMTHVDFMFGSRDMHVDGITHDGEVVAVFRDGNFVL